MKALLLAPEGWEKDGTDAVRLWPGDRTIPDGWEEIALEHPHEIPPQRCAVDGGLELCSCGHDRRSHAQHAKRCLVRRNAVNCACKAFEGAA